MRTKLVLHAFCFVLSTEAVAAQMPTTFAGVSVDWRVPMSTLRLEIPIVNAGIASSSNELIAIAQFDRRILVFDTDGRLRSTFGGRKQLSRIANVGLLGDTVWALDPVSQRILLFSPNGGAPSTRPFSQLRIRAAMDSSEWDLGVPLLLADGVIATDVRSAVTSAGGMADAGRKMILSKARSSPKLDTLSFYDQRNRFLLTPTGGYGARTLINPIAFADLETTDPYGRMVVTVNFDTTSDKIVATVTARGANGRPVFRRQLRYPRNPITPTQLDEAVEAATKPTIASRPAPMSNEEKEGVRTTLTRSVREFPYSAPISNVVVGADSSIWLRQTSFREHKWTVLSMSNGSQREVILPPARLRVVLGANRRSLWAFEGVGDPPVTSLVRYRLPQ